MLSAEMDDQITEAVISRRSWLRCLSWRDRAWGPFDSARRQEIGASQEILDILGDFS